MSALMVLPGKGRIVIPSEAGGLGVIELLAREENRSAAVVEHPLPPHTLAAPLHLHHNEDEISYVLEGEVTMLLGDEVLTAPTGSLVLKPRNQMHTFWNASDQPARILEIIAPAGFEHYFQELGAVIQRGAPDFEIVKGIAQKYGLELDFASVQGLVSKYKLQFGGAPPR